MLTGVLITDDRYAYLSVEGDRWLIEPFLLRIPNVGRDDLVEGKSVVGLLEFFAEDFGLDSEFTSNGIFDFAKAWVK